MSKRKDKTCPKCNGKGSRNCVLGNLPCGACGATGRVPLDYGQDEMKDFARAVKASLSRLAPSPPPTKGRP